jgi:hypothetical protein
MGISWLDLAIAVYLKLHLVTGYQQGLFLGGMNLLAFLGAAGLGLALGGSSWLHVLLPAVLAFGTFKWLEARAVKRWGPELAERPRTQALDRWLGLLPGLAWGCLGAGVFAWLVAAFAGGLPPGTPLAGALLAVVQAPLAAVGQAIPSY